MGITIGNKYHSLKGGYSMLFDIRQIIASTIDLELGKLYKSMPSYLCTGKIGDTERFDTCMNDLLAKKDIPESLNDVLNFLFMSDTDGKISHNTCNKIYNIIENVDNKSIGYVAYNQSLDDFKCILKECYSKRMNLVWY